MSKIPPQRMLAFLNFFNLFGRNHKFINWFSERKGSKISVHGIYHHCIVLENNFPAQLEGIGKFTFFKSKRF